MCEASFLFIMRLRRCLEMKKIINILWWITGISILIFLSTVFFADTAVVTWRVLSVTLPITAICFWSGVVLSVIDYIRSKK